MHIWPTSKEDMALSRRIGRQLCRASWQHSKDHGQITAVVTKPPAIFPERKCGGCTACCKALQVEEGDFLKPIHTWCPFCVVGTGCGNYATRFKVCRDFQCGYLKGLGDDEERPDRTKVIPDFHKEGLLHATGVLQLWEVSAGALTKRYAQGMTCLFVSMGIPVIHIPIHGGKTIFLPEKMALPCGVREALEADKIRIAVMRQRQTNLRH